MRVERLQLLWSDEGALLRAKLPSDDRITLFVIETDAVGGCQLSGIALPDGQDGCEFGSAEAAKEAAQIIFEAWVIRNILRHDPRLFPKIVCLCGSTKFWREFQRQSLRLTLEGAIVLSIGAASGTDDEHFGNLPREEYDRLKLRLDELHKRKVDLCDEVLVLNVGGYIGESTRSEIEYAERIGKPVTWLQARECRLCHCTEADCSQCIERTGQPCHWVGPDLCSACAEQAARAAETLATEM